MEGPGQREWVAWMPPGSEEVTNWLGSRHWALVEGHERDPDSPTPIWLTFGHDETGSLICVGMVIGRFAPWDRGPTPVTARLLRSIPLPELINIALSAADVPDEYGAALRNMLDRAPASVTPAARPGPRGHGDEHFRFVAEAYRRAVTEHPRAPVKYLAEQLDRPEVTVRRWIQRARDKGFLGASTPGRAGDKGSR